MDPEKTLKKLTSEMEWRKNIGDNMVADLLTEAITCIEFLMKEGEHDYLDAGQEKGSRT